MHQHTPPSATQWRRAPDRLGRHLRALGRDAIELCRHDEVVLVQTLDLLGVQRDRGVAPAKPDLGMMSLGFGECGCALDEGEGLAEILETVGPLDPLRSVKQLPIRRLPMVARGLLLRQRRYAAAAGRATFFGEC